MVVAQRRSAVLRILHGEFPRPKTLVQQHLQQTLLATSPRRVPYDSSHVFTLVPKVHVASSKTKAKKNLLARVSSHFEENDELRGELQLRKDDLIEVLTQTEDGWTEGVVVFGSKVGAKGLIPSSYLETLGAKNFNCRLGLVLQDFDENDEIKGELELRKDDLVEIKADLSDGWIKGRIIFGLKSGSVGLVPLSHLRILESASSATKVDL